MLERYGHGGDLITAEAEYGRPAGGFLDFSSNMNPFGPPEVVGEIVQSGWREISRYPDPAVRELRRKLADKYDIEPESILVGNGAAELIDLAIRVLGPGATGIARPSFTEYEEAVVKIGGATVDIPLHAESGFSPQEQEIREAVRRTDLLALGHPNNPTGQLLDPELMRALAREGVPLLLDEAFMDFVPDERAFSLLRDASRTPHVHVLRSMTKFYAIPGIRLGFIVSHPNSVRRLRERQVPWSVNYFAQRIGAAVLDDIEYEERTHRWLAEESVWLRAELGRLGLTVFPGRVNYVLFALPQRNPDRPLRVQEVQRRMGERGILIRDASRFQGLDDRYVRVAIKLRGENERLVQALEEVIGSIEAEEEGAR